MSSSKIHQRSFTPVLKEVIIEAQESTQLIENTIHPHVANKDNPHTVTANQVSTYTIEEIEAKLSAVEGQIPVITSGTEDLEDGVSPLPFTHIYIVYEEEEV